MVHFKLAGERHTHRRAGSLSSEQFSRALNARSPACLRVFRRSLSQSSRADKQLSLLKIIMIDLHASGQQVPSSFGTYEPPFLWRLNKRQRRWRGSLRCQAQLMLRDPLPEDVKQGLNDGTNDIVDPDVVKSRDCWDKPDRGPY